MNWIIFNLVELSTEFSFNLPTGWFLTSVLDNFDLAELCSF